MFGSRCRCFCWRLRKHSKKKSEDRKPKKILSTTLFSGGLLARKPCVLWRGTMKRREGSQGAEYREISPTNRFPLRKLSGEKKLEEWEESPTNHFPQIVSNECVPPSERPSSSPHTIGRQRTTDGVGDRHRRSDPQHLPGEASFTPPGVPARTHPKEGTLPPGAPRGGGCWGTHPPDPPRGGGGTGKPVPDRGLRRTIHEGHTCFIP